MIRYEISIQKTHFCGTSDFMITSRGPTIIEVGYFLAAGMIIVSVIVQQHLHFYQSQLLRNQRLISYTVAWK